MAQEIVLSVLAVEMQKSFGVAVRMQLLGGDIAEVLPVHLAVVHGRHVTVPDENVVSPVFHAPADHVGMGVLENAVLPAQGGVADVGHVGVVVGRGKDLVQIGDVELFHPAFPLDYVYASLSHGRHAGRLAPTVLQRTDESVRVVQGVDYAKATIMAYSLNHFLAPRVGR